MDGAGGGAGGMLRLGVRWVAISDKDPRPLPIQSFTCLDMVRVGCSACWRHEPSSI